MESYYQDGPLAKKNLNNSFPSKKTCKYVTLISFLYKITYYSSLVYVLNTAVYMYKNAFYDTFKNVDSVIPWTVFSAN